MNSWQPQLLIPSYHHRCLLPPSIPSIDRSSRLQCAAGDRRPRRLLILPAVSCRAIAGSKDEISPRLPPAAVPPSTINELRVLMTGSGTGSHIYPAIAISDELRAARSDAQILFVGSDSGVERDAVSLAGFDYAAVPAAPLAPILSPENILFPIRFLRSIFHSLRIIRRFRPQIVVGTGGCAAASVCLAAAMSRVKIVIQEQESFPGISSRAIAPYSEKIFLSFNGCVKHFPKEKCVVYGNPVRLSLRRYISRAAARAHFFPNAGAIVGDDEAQVVLVLGGCNGAHALNIAMLNMYQEMLAKHRNRFIVWQTGADGFSEMESLVKKHRRLLITPFLHTMDLAYAAADVVVSRAGAMTCTEILTTGKPSILIPSPLATDDHQTKNAYIMADVALSKVLPEDELDSSALGTAVDEVLGDEKLMMEMSRRAMNAARPNASTAIARDILSLIGSCIQQGA